ncbi:MAG TPA: hypothetical protein VEZ20_13565 [Allosphingosinicella sp.]|nr:hypothetical protein [Allosphingosinicella sp.]
MKVAAPFSSLLSVWIVSCAPVPEAAPAPPRVEARSAQGFDREEVRREVESHVAARLGGEAARLAAGASTSVMVTHHQGFPRPIQNPDGSVGYEPPGANAFVRGPAGWTGWAGAAQRPVAAARAAEIDRILADPRFWAEPDHVPPACTDAGARRLVVRHAGRTAVRQQGCGGQGLTGRLWELVFGGPG